MNEQTRSALRAAVDFLNNDEARDLLGLHRIRVNSELMTRGQVADLLQAALATTDATPAPAQRERDMEELLRSAHAIAVRRGTGTAWDRFAASIAQLGIGAVTARTYRLLPTDHEGG